MSDLLTKNYSYQQVPTEVTHLGCSKRIDFIQVDNLSSREPQLLVKTVKCTFLRQRRGQPIQTKCHYGPWLVHLYLNEGSKFKVWLIQIALFLLVETMCVNWLWCSCYIWSVKNANVNLAEQIWLDRAGLSPLVKILFGELLHKRWLRSQEYHVGSLAVQSVAFPWM